GFTKALQGLASGVITASGSGQPGEEAEIRIRGFSSFGDASPLIVLDGFPFDGNLSSIPLSEIASISVLKDASATALYGSRAASGVIIISTKSGLPGTSELNLRVRYGISNRAVPDYNRVTVPEYYELQWEGIRNALVTSGTDLEDAGILARQQLVSTLGGYNAWNVPDGEVVDNNGRINSNAELLWHDNWQEELFVTGKRSEIALQTKGGSEKTTYFLSGTVLNEDGIIQASNLKKYAARANVDTQINPWIKAGINFSGSLSEQNYPVSTGNSYLNPFNFAGMIAPIYPVYLYNEEGELQTDADGNKLYDYGSGYGRSRSYGSNLNPLGTTALDERLYKKDVFT
ncbi:MAG: TonB-dependent receptor plug domain-containing protein, partial [Bacteroidales bacterium]|nr:TonB-dependent receptor plug domain-containing protein [Bacteroidales bacterium]